MTRHWIITLILATVLLAACAPVDVPPLSIASKPASEPSPIPTETVVPTETIVPSPTPAQTMPAYENPYLPRAGDEHLTRGEVYIATTELLTRESEPPQIVLILRGNLPTPCNELRVVVNPPDEQNRINVDAYSLFDPNKICVQLLSPFDANIPLGSFTPGRYSVWVNGRKVGDFDS